MALNKSVLDAVLENAHRTRGKLGAVDQKTFDEFLDSVRTVEQRATGVFGGNGRGGLQRSCATASTSR